MPDVPLSNWEAIAASRCPQTAVVRYARADDLDEGGDLNVADVALLVSSMAGAGGVAGDRQTDLHGDRDCDPMDTMESIGNFPRISCAGARLQA